MANKRAFEIAFVGLKPGVHQFNYDLDDKFFAEKGAEDFTNAQANVKLSLEKNTGFMLLKFEIGGKADVSCDRCGNPLTMDLWDEFKVVVKLVDNPDEMNMNEEDPDVFYIARTESHLEVSDWLYEFAMLSVPTQRMCGENERGGSKCNNEVLEKLKQMEVKEEHNANTLWKGLDKFKEN
ncbi:DUF177 domain-containing protein [Ferruginibacter sp. HRS2-29]|uniref:YceD family protein n=1 Tax=Ferruginibacter sp. HRS2-29 TaxID=2487334 RepID=UPI0020CE105D|nr:DUF177 domain-containing protein [Ferruginibacter sp. HRS2-29]MCP9749413.1 DUF177 domain-containing protein [Ferruginibacter sp. HRS2-29]